MCSTKFTGDNKNYTLKKEEAGATETSSENISVAHRDKDKCLS